MVLKLEHAVESTESILKHKLFGPRFGVSDSVGLGCISNKFLGSDDVASQRPYFENHCSRGIGIDLRKLICNICYNVHKNHPHRV